VDVKRNPALKEKLLAGGLNLAQCQVCGFVGQLPVPFVYHDPEKELLLTFTPPDAKKTIEQKESDLAPLLKDVTDSLEPDQRKGYLFQPQSMLTMNNLVKNVLIGDGITEEMIQKQQDKMKLLEQLFTKTGDELKKSIQENNADIDREFFALFSEIAQRVLVNQDEESIQKIQEIQEILMAETDVGKEILKESQEIQAARDGLEALGQNLTRESLLELVIKAPTMERIQAMASLVRPAMDYEFFQMFTAKIENDDSDTRNELIEKRNFLLKITQEIDKELENRIGQSRDLINKIIQTDEMEQAVIGNLNSIDQFFIQALSGELELAEQQKDQEKRSKLEKLLQFIQEITTPPELKVMDQLLEKADNSSELADEVKSLDAETLSNLIEYMTSIINQYEERMKTSNDEDKQKLEGNLNQIKTVYNAILKESMKQKMAQD
jgi:hypothetical protein